MASVQVKSALMLNTGEVVNLESTMTEGTETELTTLDGMYSVGNISLGQFANGKSITSIIQPPSAPNGISYAYIDRRGEIFCIMPVAVEGVQVKPCPMLKSFVLQAGDTLRVMAKTASNRLNALNTITADGIHSIFTATTTGDNAQSAVQIKSGQGLGESLTGKRIISHWATSIDGSKIESGGGFYYINDKGLPIGGTTATDPSKQQPTPNGTGGCMVNLNFVARIQTSA